MMGDETDGTAAILKVQWFGSDTNTLGLRSSLGWESFGSLWDTANGQIGWWNLCEIWLTKTARQIQKMFHNLQHEFT